MRWGNGIILRYSLTIYDCHYQGNMAHHHEYQHLHHPCPCQSQNAQKKVVVFSQGFKGQRHHHHHQQAFTLRLQPNVKLLPLIAQVTRWVFLPIFIIVFSTVVITSTEGQSHDAQKSSYNTILALFKELGDSEEPAKKATLRNYVSAHIKLLNWQIDKFQAIEYGQSCDSVEAEQTRHELTDLVAQVTVNPNETVFSQIENIHTGIIKEGKMMCIQSKGLACDNSTGKCSCYTGHRHSDLAFEPVRENGICKLDEMSRCYSPSFMVSKGFPMVFRCIHGAMCVSDISGRRCILPEMTENCHCQKPCPDGSFSNLMDELRKCIAKLGEISILGFGDNCTIQDQVSRDEIVQVLERSGSEKAGPIIRGIKKLLASSRRLCDPMEQLVCHPDLQSCVCGPEKDGILYERVNQTCLWAKGSRCFPEDTFANATGSNGSCIEGTQCFIEGLPEPCDPKYEEPSCYCQSPEDLESSGIVLAIVLVLVAIVGGGGAVGFLIHAKIISCPLGGSPANV